MTVEVVCQDCRELTPKDSVRVVKTVSNQKLEVIEQKTICETCLTEYLSTLEKMLPEDQTVIIERFGKGV